MLDKATTHSVKNQKKGEVKGGITPPQENPICKWKETAEKSKRRRWERNALNHDKKETTNTNRKSKGKTTPNVVANLEEETPHGKKGGFRSGSV